MLNSEETLSQKFVRRGSWIFLFTLLTAPLGYIIRMVLTGDLSKDEVGIIYGVIGLLTLFSAYNDLGFTESLNYFLPKYIIKKDYARCKYLLTTAFWIQIVTSTLVGGLFYLSAGFLADWHFKSAAAKEIIQIMSLFFVGLNLMQVSTILFSATQNTRLQKGADFFRFFATTLGVLILFFIGKGDLITYAWMWIGGLYIGVIFSSILSYRYYYVPYFSKVQSEVDTKLRKTFIKYSLGTFLTANVGTLLHMLDQQILQNMTSTSEGATYAMYLSLVNIPFIFLSPLIAFLFPVVSELTHSGSMDKLKTLHSHFSTALIVIMLWASGVFITIGPAIAGLIYGESYISSGTALSYIAPFLVLNVLISINFQIMAGAGMVRERVKILLQTLSLNIALILGMIWGYKEGILGFPSATSATAFAVGFAWILMWIQSYRAIRAYRGSLDMGWIFPNLIVILLGVGIYILFHIHIPTLGLTGRLAYTPEIATIVMVSMILFMIINYQKMREFLRTIFRVRREKSLP